MTTEDVVGWQQRRQDQEHRHSLNDVQSGILWDAYLKGQIPAVGDYSLQNHHFLSTVRRAPIAVVAKGGSSFYRHPDGPGSGKPIPCRFNLDLGALGQRI